MLFNSLHFVVFFLVVLTLNQYFRPYPTAQKWMLLLASYYFYGQWHWEYLLLIWFSTLIDYLIGLRLAVSAKPKRLIAISVLVNLGFLGIFKYANWIIDSINQGAIVMNSAVHITPLDVLLPVGISFYTFQSLSYTIDVYRGVLPPRRNLLDYALVVAFFPQLEAGPIVRASEFFGQLDRERRVDFAKAQRALVLIAFGFLKKMVFADSLAGVVDPVFDHPSGAGFWTTLLAVYAFAFQIYCDFSGYTDIAIGCALLLGYEFPQNFNYPYIAESIQDFWRRWHMTLSRWLRDYLYISLGGSHKGQWRTLLNLMITMLLGGLWHGASWNFVIWGGLHGSYLVMERLLLFRLPFWNAPTALMRCVRWFLTFHLVCFAWIFFRAKTLEDSLAMLRNLFRATTHDFIAGTHLGLALLILMLVASQFLGFYGKLKHRLNVDRGPKFALAMSVILLALIWFTPGTTIPFIYFQF